MTGGGRTRLNRRGEDDTKTNTLGAGTRGGDLGKCSEQAERTVASQDCRRKCSARDGQRVLYFRLLEVVRFDY